MPIQLTSRQRANLRGMAMNLKPVAQIGKLGLTDTAVREISFALQRMELVKVRVAAADRDSRSALMAELAEKTDSAFCGATGTSACYYRPADKPVIKID
jgi:RNA-binding protein